MVRTAFVLEEISMLLEIANPAILRNIADRRAALKITSGVLEGEIKGLTSLLDKVTALIGEQHEDGVDETLLWQEDNFVYLLGSAEADLILVKAELGLLEKSAKFTARTLKPRKLQTV